MRWTRYVTPLLFSMSQCSTSTYGEQTPATETNKHTSFLCIQTRETCVWSLFFPLVSLPHLSVSATLVCEWASFWKWYGIAFFFFSKFLLCKGLFQTSGCGFGFRLGSVINFRTVYIINGGSTSNGVWSHSRSQSCRLSWSLKKAPKYTKTTWCECTQVYLHCTVTAKSSRTPVTEGICVKW